MISIPVSLGSSSLAVRGERSGGSSNPSSLPSFWGCWLAHLLGDIISQHIAFSNHSQRQRSHRQVSRQLLVAQMQASPDSLFHNLRTPRTPTFLLSQATVSLNLLCLHMWFVHHSQPTAAAPSPEPRTTEALFLPGLVSVCFPILNSASVSMHIAVDFRPTNCPWNSSGPVSNPHQQEGEQSPSLYLGLIEFCLQSLT